MRGGAMQRKKRFVEPRLQEEAALAALTQVLVSRAEPT
jgi:hypothetical protein